MNSPVEIPFKSFIQLKPNESTAIYLQIVFEFIKAIQTGFLPEGTKLPGTRILCRQLSVNRNTLIKAFQDLESQGWIETLPNKGTFILDPKPKKTALKAQSNKIGDVHRYPKNTGFPFETSFLLSSTNEYSEAKYSLNDGQPDLRLHPVYEFSKWYSASMKRKSLI